MGWLTFYLAACVHLFLFPEIDFLRIRHYFLVFLWGFIVTALLRYFYQVVYRKSFTILTLTLIVSASSLLVGNVWFWGSSWFHYGLLHESTWRMWFQETPGGDLIFGILRDSIIIAGWSSLYFAIKFWNDWNLQREMTKKANVLAQKAQLQMLRYQLNPHFLFNSLNSIRALITEDKQNAKAMITELSEFLRYSLVSKNYAEVPLSNELEAIRHYFAVEKIRYEDKLEVSFQIDPQAEDFPVISFLLHPLAENAIKYGMQTSSMPLRIQIRAKVFNGSLRLEIENTGKWIEPTEDDELEIGTGTGLKNVRQRLENAYPSKHRFEIQENNGRVRIMLTIT